MYHTFANSKEPKQGVHTNRRLQVANFSVAQLILQSTLQPLYNTVRYNTVLDITRFKDGSQKYIDYIEK